MPSLKIRKQLRTLATQARKQAEEFAKQWGYCTIGMDMMCAHGSAILFDILSNAGLKPRFAIQNGEAEGHVFVECSGFIVDITASQFRENGIAFDKVMIWPADSDDREHFWQATHHCDNVAELTRTLIGMGWCETQIPGLIRADEEI